MGDYCNDSELLYLDFKLDSIQHSLAQLPSFQDFKFLFIDYCIMQKPLWLRQIEENYLPEKLVVSSKKLEKHTQALGRSIRSAGETLAEKATTGKGKYLTNPIPYLGDWVYLPTDPTNSSRIKKIKYAAAVTLGTVRATGLIGLAIVRDPIFLPLYLGLTIGEEATITALHPVLPEMYKKPSK
jgi:hypothetical protein